MLNTTTKQPEAPCPGCGAMTNASTAVEDGDRPAPGDYSICSKCTAMLVFASDLTVRLLTPEEFTALNPDVAYEMGRLRKAVVATRPEK